MKNKMDMADNDITSVGQFDADELKFIQENEECRKMVEEGRIGLNFEDYDCGTVWVKLGDAVAFAVASEIVM